MAKPKARPRKRGRPALPPEQRKRNNVTIRLRDKLKSVMQDAGTAQGRSLSEEIEARLEASLLDEEARNRELGGKELLAIFRLFSAAAEIIEARTEKKWTRDWDTAAAVHTAWTQLFKAAMPKMPKEVIEAEKHIPGREGNQSEFLQMLEGGLQNLRSNVKFATYVDLIATFEEDLAEGKIGDVMDEKKKRRVRESKKKLDEFNRVTQRVSTIGEIGRELVLDLFPEPRVARTRARAVSSAKAKSKGPRRGEKEI